MNLSVVINLELGYQSVLLCLAALLHEN